MKEHPWSDEVVKVERQLKNLKRCAVIFAVIIAVNLIGMIAIAQIRISVMQIAILLLMVSLAWSGWNATREEKYLKEAIAAGPFCFKIYLVVCILQLALGVYQAGKVGIVPAFAGFVEMLVYTLLVWFYQKNAKQAEELLADGKLRKAATYSGQMAEDETKE